MDDTAAKSALSYHFKPVDTHDANDPFTGPPSQEVDDAWSDLLSGREVVCPRMSHQANLDIRDSLDHPHLAGGAAINEPHLGRAP